MDDVIKVLQEKLSANRTTYNKKIILAYTTYR